MFSHGAVFEGAEDRQVLLRFAADHYIGGYLGQGGSETRSWSLCIPIRIMQKSSSSYRLAALSLLFSFSLGAALLATCPISAEAGSPDAANHSATPCAAPCHAMKASQNELATVPLASDRLSTFPDLFPADRAAPDHERLTSPAPLRTPAASRRHAQLASPPVRLHVFHAVFLN